MGLGGWIKNNAGALTGAAIGGPVGGAAGGILFSDALKSGPGLAAMQDTANRAAQYGGPDAAAFQIGDRWTGQLDQMGRDAQRRKAAQARAAQLGPAAQLSGEQQDWRGRQSALADALQRQAAGEGPSAAGMQLQRGLEAARKQQLAQAAASSGANRALAQRTAAQNIGTMSQDASAQAAMLRAQEQQAAQQQLGQLTGQARAQDIGVAGQDANLQQQAMLQQGAFNQQTNMANLQAQMQQQGMNDAMTQYYMSQGFTRDQAQQQAAAQQQMLEAQNYQAQLGALSGAYGSDKQMQGQMLGGLFSAGGAAVGGLAKSDRNAKKRIKREAKKIDQMIRKLRPYSYDYKDKADGAGRQYGIMAQDLERSEAGRSLVVDTLEGKKIDTVRGYGAVLASLRRLDERLGKVEKKKKVA